MTTGGPISLMMSGYYDLDNDLDNDSWQQTEDHQRYFDLEDWLGICKTNYDGSLSDNILYNSNFSIKYCLFSELYEKN